MILVFIVGRWITKGLTKFAENVMNNRQVDPTIVIFTTIMTYIALLVFVVLAALGQLGIQPTSFIAVIGAAGISIPFPQRDVHMYEHKE